MRTKLNKILFVGFVLFVFGGAYWFKHVEGPRQTAEIKRELELQNMPLGPETVFEALDELAYIFVDTAGGTVYPMDISMYMFQEDGLDLGWYLSTTKGQYACEYGERNPIPPQIIFTLFYGDTPGPSVIIEPSDPRWKIESDTYTLDFETDRTLVSIWIYENKRECNQSNWAVLIQPK